MRFSKTINLSAIRQGATELSDVSFGWRPSIHDSAQRKPEQIGMRRIEKRCGASPRLRAPKRRVPRARFPIYAQASVTYWVRPHGRTADCLGLLKAPPMGCLRRLQQTETVRCTFLPVDSG